MNVRRICFLIFALFFASNFQLSAAAPGKTPGEGELFPDLKLPIPSKIEEREYLKVDGPFLVSQLDSDIVIIQIFSLYCPHCQREAPNVNNLYKAISSRPDLKSRIKIIGVGAGNSTYEVNAFRNLSKVEFPLLPDPDFKFHKSIGEVRTPYFFVLAKKGKAREVIYSRLGSFGDPESFIDLIAAKTGIGKRK